MNILSERGAFLCLGHLVLEPLVPLYLVFLVLKTDDKGHGLATYKSPREIGLGQSLSQTAKLWSDRRILVVSGKYIISG